MVEVDTCAGRLESFDGPEAASLVVGNSAVIDFGLAVRAPRILDIEPLLELPASLPPSKSTIRLFFFFLPRTAANWGEGACDGGPEVLGEVFGLDLVPAALVPFVGRSEGLPTGTEGGVTATETGRDEVICSGGGEVRYLFS